MKKLIVSLLLTLAAFGAWAQTLSPAQLLVLRTNILADVTLAPKCTSSGDGPFEIAAAYNLPATPAFVVWKTNVSITEVGDNINGTELAGLSSLNTTRLQAVIMLSQGGINPTLGDRRKFFDDIFSGTGGALTRASLLALWKRTATRAERLFATGNGLDATPGVLVFEGALSVAQVQAACTQ